MVGPTAPQQMLFDNATSALPHGIWQVDVARPGAGGPTQVRKFGPASIIRIAESNTKQHLGDRIKVLREPPHFVVSKITYENMAPKRIGGSSSRSYNPITNVYNAFFVGENASILRSIAAFGVSTIRSG
jgi:hypothetical protein